jgi:lysophospholipase L1-like esterase
MRISVIPILFVLVLPSFATAEVTVQAPLPPPMFNPPKTYYLALGDSVTYGYQAWKFRQGLPPSAFDTGYVDVFGARLRQIQPAITIVNYGCPGETSSSFITGQPLCPWIAGAQQLHDSFSGSQLEAAVAFLKAHPGEVNPITITLWGNDVGAVVGVCGGDLTCIQQRSPDAIKQLATNISTILQQLRSAAPNAEIIVTGAWDSFIGAFEYADPLFQALNASLAEVTTLDRARFADPFPVFNPQGDPNAEIQAICTLTLLCTQNDSHPSDLGYRVLGDLVFDASGYIRLID